MKKRDGKWKNIVRRHVQFSCTRKKKSQKNEMFLYSQFSMKNCVSVAMTLPSIEFKKKFLFVTLKTLFLSCQLQ
jgi:hypothetical protein